MVLERQFIEANTNKEQTGGALRARLRLDFKGGTRGARLLFGGRSPERAAEEAREQQVALLRNMPLQGLTIQDVNSALEVYTMEDDLSGTEVTYAPVELVVVAETLDALVRFVLRLEIRRIEVLEPEEVVLSRRDLERVLFEAQERMRYYTGILERKLASR